MLFLKCFNFFHSETLQQCNNIYFSKLLWYILYWKFIICIAIFKKSQKQKHFFQVRLFLLLAIYNQFVSYTFIVGSVFCRQLFSFDQPYMLLHGYCSLPQTFKFFMHFVHFLQSYFNKTLKPVQIFWLPFLPLLFLYHCLFYSAFFLPLVIWIWQLFWLMVVHCLLFFFYLAHFYWFIFCDKLLIITCNTDANFSILYFSLLKKLLGTLFRNYSLWCLCIYLLLTCSQPMNISWNMQYYFYVQFFKKMQLD